MYRRLTIFTFVLLSVCAFRICSEEFKSVSNRGDILIKESLVNLEENLQNGKDPNWVNVGNSDNIGNSDNSNNPTKNKETSTSIYQYILKTLIIISAISFSISLIMIVITVYNRSVPSNSNSLDNGYLGNDYTINLSFSENVYEGKVFDTNILETNYELMTTEIEESEDKEINIRDI